MKINNELVTDPTIIATELNTFFLDSVYEITQLFNSPSNSIRSISCAQPIFYLQQITELEVLNTINSLKNSKAMDIYGLDMNFIKRHKEVLIQPITHLINQSLSQSIVPSAWKMALVTPIFKSGERSDMDNYRPISILPVVSKILEKWVAKLLIQHLNKSNDLFHPMQFGFRAQHSTETANCLFLEKVKGYLERSSYVGAVFVDLKRAFDTVNHEVLLSKLAYFNLSEQALNWIKSYLSCRKQCVCINDSKSPFSECPVRVPQGSILGPILFTLYINDLPEHVKMLMSRCMQMML